MQKFVLGLLQYTVKVSNIDFKLHIENRITFFETFVHTHGKNTKITTQINALFRVLLC